jgi:hypothetical protein
MKTRLQKNALTATRDSYLQIELKILPLEESRVTRALHEALEGIASQVIENLLDVRFEEICWDFILL